ncbi:MAG: glycosyltransferase family 4 protein [Pyrinomonadaceae bacterium]
MAWLSPLPPQRSGIANYSYWLVRALNSHFDIDLYYDNQPPVAELKNEFDVYPISGFAGRHKSYDEVIYHLGNNSSFHKNIYELSWNFPGTVVLHDYNLSAFMRDAFFRENNELYRQALPNGHGARLHALIQRVIPDAAKSPMSHAVVRRSKKVIVHHRWVKEQFAQSDHIEVIPMFAKLNYRPTQADINEFKKKFLIKNSQFVITCLGFVNSNKLPKLQIDVVKKLIDDGYPVKMVFAGEPSPEVKTLESDIRSGKYSHDIIFTGYQNEMDYFSAIFVSDIIINLRNPSMGEASLTLMQALSAAKPTIVSDINQYREFPDKVCWKLTHDENQEEVLYAYISTLLADRNLRGAISANAAEYVNSVLGWENIIAQWMRVVLK